MIQRYRPTERTEGERKKKREKKRKKEKRKKEKGRKRNKEILLASNGLEELCRGRSELQSLPTLQGAPPVSPIPRSWSWS